MNSENVLSFFKEITAIPRESGHEEHIIAYLQDFAAKNGLECKTDEAGNVLITKPARQIGKRALSMLGSIKKRGLATMHRSSLIINFK